MLEIINLKKSYWDKYKLHNFEVKNEKILKIIVEVFNKNTKEIGYRVITNKLKSEHNININHKKVLQIMKENNICAEFARKMRKKSQESKIKKQSNISYTDLIKRNFKDVKTRFTVLYTGNIFNIRYA